MPKQEPTYECQHCLVTFEGKEQFCYAWDLSSIPEDVLLSENQRRRNGMRKTRAGGRPRKERSMSTVYGEPDDH